MTEGTQSHGGPGVPAGTLWEALRALLPGTQEELRLELGDTVDRSVVLLLRQATEHFYGDRLAECLQDSEALLDVVWERLNTGPWRDVHKDWRRVYAFGCLLKALCLCQAPREATAVTEALRVCDMGLLMGAAILGDVLLKAATVLQAHLGSGKRPACPGPEPPGAKVQGRPPCPALPVRFYPWVRPPRGPGRPNSSLSADVNEPPRVCFVKNPLFPISARAAPCGAGVGTLWWEKQLRGPRGAGRRPPGPARLSLRSRRQSPARPRPWATLDEPGWLHAQPPSPPGCEGALRVLSPRRERQACQAPAVASWLALWPGHSPREQGFTPGK